MGTPARRLLLFDSADYRQKVLSYGPIAYWMQDEPGGAVAYCQVNNAQNGAYTGVTFGGAGIGDGNTAPFYDGANDFCNVLTATLIARFSGVEGSLMLWCKVTNAGVWADGAERRCIDFEGAGDFLILRKDSGANSFTFLYNDTAGTQTQTVTTSTTAWFCSLVTWSATANQVIYYYNGAQQGLPDACAGWGVALTTRAVIGAGNVTPTLVWNGWLAHCAVWNRALAPAEVVALATV